MKSTRIDKILAILDQPQQRSNEGAFALPDTDCWRCGHSLPEGGTPLGACDACVKDLQAEREPEPVGAFTRTLESGHTLDPRGQVREQVDEQFLVYAQEVSVALIALFDAMGVPNAIFVDETGTELIDYRFIERDNHGRLPHQYALPVEIRHPIVMTEEGPYLPPMVDLFNLVGAASDYVAIYARFGRAGE